MDSKCLDYNSRSEDCCARIDAKFAILNQLCLVGVCCVIATKYSPQRTLSTDQASQLAISFPEAAFLLVSTKEATCGRRWPKTRAGSGDEIDQLGAKLGAKQLIFIQKNRRPGPSCSKNG